MERVKTGNVQLDRILSGGFPVAAINLVIGRPGTGKTVLAEQLAFSCATAERPALYLTTLSEPIENVVNYVQQFTFGDADRVGTQVIYESLEHVLREKQPQELSEHVRALILQHAPSLVVIDSIKALRDLLGDIRAWRELVFDLSRTLTVFNTVSLWVGEYDPSEKGEVEFAVADGILEMHRVQTDSVDSRFLRVAKLRGSSFLDGEHAFQITADGLQIYPRLVSPPVAPDYLAHAERLSSGIEGLDDLLETGWLRGTTTMVAGPSGAGKTMLGLHFLRQGAVEGEPGLLVNFQENPTQLRRVMESLGWDSGGLLRPGAIDQIYTSPVELRVDAVVKQLFERIERDGVRRVVIDALGDLRWGISEERYLDYVYALNQCFATRNITAMEILETPHGDPGTTGERLGHQISPMSDNLLLLTVELGDELTRSLRVLKSRASAHDGRRRVMQISRTGIKVS